MVFKSTVCFVGVMALPIDCGVRLRHLARRPIMIVYLCDGIKDVPWDSGEIFGGNSSICHDCHGIYCV